MPIRVVRLGDPRERGETLRIGAVRRPPRGVRKEEYAARGFHDVWLPELAPSAELVERARQAASEREWAAFERSYRAELKNPEKCRLLDLLAALSRQTDFSIGCYCEVEARCHRSILRRLLAERGAALE